MESADPELRRFLANQRALEELLALRNPPKVSHWFDSPLLVGLLTGLVTLVVTTFLNLGVQYLNRRAEQQVSIRRARLENAESRINDLAGLVTGLLWSADMRAKMAKGRFDDLDTTDLRKLRDSTNSADERWGIGKQTSQFFLQFHFGGDETVTGEWSHARDLLQLYADCADSVYRKFLDSVAPAGACLSQRDAAYKGVESFNAQLLRGFRKLEAF